MEFTAEIVLFYLYTLAWVFLCVVVERVFKGDTQEDHDIKNRIVSIVHGLVTLGLAAHHILTTPFHYCVPTSENEQFIIRLSVTYFIYDFAACIYYGIWDKSLVIHHFSSITGFMFAYCTDVGAKISILGLLVAECSNFPMHMRVILRLKGLRHTKLFNLFEIAYLVIYVLVRGGLCLPMMIIAFNCSATSPVIPVMCSILGIQSYFFIAQIIPILKNKYHELMELQQKGVQTYWLTHNPAVEALDYFKRSKKQNIF
jgi:hypothetical protein